ncbi:MAG TPA: LysE family transporter [Rhizomicrobium sp.]|jgi:threonine/homoserine/homoserine lactone efflux protein|nr:LysE family transporter [Rhizomicrobium sp.]
MNYILLVCSGVIMGLIAAAPIGPVNLICIRRTFAYGSVNGFVSGLGAALGDGVFAAVTGFGLTWIAQLIEGYSTIIELIGGALLVWFGYRAFIAPPACARLDDDDRADKGASTLARAMASTFALTITNPATLLAFTAMFASFGGLVGGAGSFVDAGFVVAGVIGGSAGWWLSLTTVIGLFHTRIDERWMRTINRGSGSLVALFGLAVLVHLVIKLA